MTSPLSRAPPQTLFTAVFRADIWTCSSDKNVCGSACATGWLSLHIIYSARATETQSWLPGWLWCWSLCRQLFVWIMVSEWTPVCAVQCIKWFFFSLPHIMAGFTCLQDLVSDSSYVHVVERIGSVLLSIVHISVCIITCHLLVFSAQDPLFLQLKTSASYVVVLFACLQAPFWHARDSMQES